MSKYKYDHIVVEKKWQNKWEEAKAFTAQIDKSKPKYYALDMFPYPSGAGLHVGHVTGYTATDVLSRYKRQKGFNVLHPMGWDSFGLPAEQYAIRTGTHPAVTTKQNIDTYRRQLKSLGFSYDWDREMATSDPKYYKWTQWIFTKLYERGLAYEAEMLVNYCPELGTVLANEEVEEGRSKEGGYPVERRPLRQWILKITAYAERLLDDLDTLDWPEHLKKAQRNWIGRSEGALVEFSEKSTGEKLPVYTTRVDTLFGVTFLVLSPEHPLVEKIVIPTQKKDVNAYIEKTSQKSDMERTELNKEKSGVDTGAFAVCPVTGNKVPIWIADYVLMGYGTGALMAVPAHDERDNEFARRYQLPVHCVIDPEISDDEQRARIFGGDESWSGPGVACNSKNEKININGLEEEEAKEAITKWLEDNGFGKRTTNYKLRDWLFSRQRYWGEPVPIVHLEDGTKRALELSELPLVPPEIEDYKPAGTGESPLAKVKEWVEVTDAKTGKKALRETNTMPQWAGSCWYYLRFLDPHNDDAAWSEEAENYWMPVDMYVGGVEHAVLHLLYARFWHKVLYDCGCVTTIEPFQTLRNQGLVTAKSYKRKGGGYVCPEEGEKDDSLIVQVEKMSKSKLNGVTPDAIIEEFGADALRLYEMFMAPFDKEKLWNTDAVIGCSRFLSKVWDLGHSERLCDEETPEALKLGHKMIIGVTQDIENMHFNTAISKMMEFINGFIPLDKHPRSIVKWLVQALNPFAPHITEELWEKLGGEGLLAHAPFPVADESFLVEQTITMVVQVNGKVRGKFEMPVDVTQDEVMDLVKESSQIMKHITGEIVKVILVPNKLINVVVRG